MCIHLPRAVAWPPGPAAGARPTSPRLIPLGSPGPVTPFELETEGGYLIAGVRADDAAAYVDQLLRVEAQRRDH